MPRTKLGDEVRRRKMEEMLAHQNHIRDLFRYALHAQNITLEELGRALNVTPQAARYRINRKPESWTIGELKQMCAILNVPYDRVLEELKRCG